MFDKFNKIYNKIIKESYSFNDNVDTTNINLSVGDKNSEDSDSLNSMKFSIFSQFMKKSLGGMWADPIEKVGIEDLVQFFKDFEDGKFKTDCTCAYITVPSIDEEIDVDVFLNAFKKAINKAIENNKNEIKVHCYDSDNQTWAMTVTF